VAAARAAWRELAPTLTPADLVFVDESGVATDLARRYGRAPGGQRAHGAVPYGRWERLTILGGLSLAGLVACMAVNGATDTDVMVAFTRHVLAPALLRGVGARTTEALHAALSTLVDAITTSDARGYFRHCGYAAQ
jgi:hypothetical protein